MKHCRLLVLVVATLLPLCVHAQNIKVSGVIKDDTGQPLPGAAVIDKQNQKNGVVTDIDGKYAITVSKDGFLEISSLGYTSVLEQVNSRTVIDVILKSEATELDDVVVVAYGTAKKSDLTGAVSTVDMKAIENVPATSIETALQGRIAGAEFVSTTGEPGMSSSIQIRGARSISAGNEPLIVVDGVVDAVSDLNEINPNDIKSISVLKDVSSTSLYGSRGANGVILITTSKPTAAKLNVKLKLGAGVSQIAGSVDIMNAAEFAEYNNMTKYFTSSLENQPQTASNYYFADPSALGEGTDWVKALSCLGVYHDYNLTLSGGSKLTRVDANFGYNNTKGVVIGSGFRRLTGRLQLTSQPFNWLKLGVKVYYANRTTDVTSAAITGTNKQAAIYLSPFLGTDAVWNTYGADIESGGGVFNNPYILATKITNQKKQDNINITPFVNFYIGKYLTLLSRFNFSKATGLRNYYAPSDLPTYDRFQYGGSAKNDSIFKYTYLSETTFSYKQSFKRAHTVDALVGFTAERVDATTTSISGTGYLDDSVGQYNMGGLLDGRNLSVVDNSTLKTAMSFLARINYNYRKRYYFTLTSRVDGSSNFAENRKWGWFPAAAFRWSIKNEKWMKKATWLNDLSLRLSAGRSGNDAISSYMSIPTLTLEVSGWMFGSYQPISYYNTRLANSNLTWEVTDSYNLGLNFSAFKERLNIEVDAYLSRTSDLLLAMKSNRAIGYDTYFTNVGSTRNFGVEGSLTTRNIVKRNFSWSTTLTVSFNNQMVEDVGENGLIGTFYNPSNSTQPLYGYMEGYPVNSLWGYQFEGVWHSQEEIDRNAITKTYACNGTPALGECRYLDVNHDGILDQNDMKYQGSSDPVVYGGFQNTLTWKGLTFQMYFTYSIGGKIYNLSEFYSGSGSRAYNKYRYMLEAWHPTRNPDSNIPRAGFVDIIGSDRMIHDASYLRLKELSLSYRWDMPAKIKWLNNVTFGFSAENLFLCKNYNGFDPDVSTEPGARRIDNASFPRPRSFVFNINLVY